MGEVEDAQYQHLLRLLLQPLDKVVGIEAAGLLDVGRDAAEQLGQHDMLFGDALQAIHSKIFVGFVRLPYAQPGLPRLFGAPGEQLPQIVEHAVIEGGVGESPGQHFVVDRFAGDLLVEIDLLAIVEFVLAAEHERDRPAVAFGGAGDDIAADTVICSSDLRAAGIPDHILDAELFEKIGGGCICIFVRLMLAFVVGLQGVDGFDAQLGELLGVQPHFAASE